MEKPISFTIDFMYLCPKCQSQSWCTDKEVTKIGKVVCWSCSEVIEFEPLTLELKYRGAAAAAPTPAQPSATQPPENASQDAIDALVITFKNMGYRASEARTLVSDGIKSGLDPANPTEFLSGVLNQCVP